jgi:hypothetical protein
MIWGRPATLSDFFEGVAGLPLFIALKKANLISTGTDMLCDL